MLRLEQESEIKRPVESGPGKPQVSASAFRAWCVCADPRAPTGESMELSEYVGQNRIPDRHVGDVGRVGRLAGELDRLGELGHPLAHLADLRGRQRAGELDRRPGAD